MGSELALPGGRLGRRTLVWVLVLGIVLCMGLVLPGLGGAHAHLTGSTPKPGETLTELPSNFSLEFDEPVEPAVSQVILVDAQGETVEGTSLRGEGNTLFLDVPALAAGEYALVWEVMSSDGHLVDGEIPFAVTQEAVAQADVDPDSPPDSVAGDPDADAGAEPAEAEAGEDLPAQGDDADQAPEDGQGGRMNWIWYLLILVLLLLILRGRRR
ncbi:MAG TPA: copper resistance protein CopC [Sphingobacteriaceae bacterium]|nr:copper resistance protein CopC [Sphingobacteriaceae bacterium]